MDGKRPRAPLLLVQPLNVEFLSAEVDVTLRRVELEST